MEAVSDSRWDWWLKALAGDPQPSLVKGVPEFGFFLLRERKTRRTPEDERKIGGPRHKVTTTFAAVAIWEDETGWHCVITRPGHTSHLTDPAEIDEGVFSPCSKWPVDHETYLAKVKELDGNND